MRALAVFRVKATYKIEVKEICRRRFRDFIGKHFSETKIRTARVLYLPGREAMEIVEIYDTLGIPHENIVCLEQRREVFIELRRRNLGIDLRNQTLVEFLDSPHEAQFDIVSLDFSNRERRASKNDVGLNVGRLVGAGRAEQNYRTNPSSECIHRINYCYRRRENR
jgi:hypothetical protein